MRSVYKPNTGLLEAVKTKSPLWKVKAGPVKNTKNTSEYLDITFFPGLKYILTYSSY